MPNKTILLGLDGATLDLIEPWANKGELPTFNKIIKKGVHGCLRSSYPPITCPAWMCICTGRRSDSLGIFGPFKFDFNKKEISVNLRGSLKYFWNNFDKPFIFNVPMTYPPQVSDKRIITSNFGAGIGDFCYPKNLFNKVENETSFFSSYKPITRSLRTNSQKYNEVINHNLELDIKTLKYLLKEDNDFFFGVTQATDHIQHMFFKDLNMDSKKDKILKIYQRIDKFLNYLLNEFPESNIIMISDHGAGINKGYFYLNNFLIKSGYLKLKKKKFRYILSKIGVTKKNLIKLLNFFHLSEYLEKKIPKKIKQSIPSEGNRITSEEAVNKKMINWKKTKAFSTQHGNLYLLDKSVKDKLVEDLELFGKENDLPLTIKEPKIKNSNFPDFFVFIDDYAYSDVGGSMQGDIIEKNIKLWEHNGNHRINGIFMAYGPDIKKGQKINAELIDVAPTILHMRGTPPPNDMDGRVLKEIFKSDSEPAKREIRYSDVSHMKEDIKESIGKLRL